MNTQESPTLDNQRKFFDQYNNKCKYIGEKTSNETKTVTAGFLDNKTRINNFRNAGAITQMFREGQFDFDDTKVNPEDQEFPPTRRKEFDFADAAAYLKATTQKLEKQKKEAENRAKIEQLAKAENEYQKSVEKGVAEALKKASGTNKETP